MKNLSIGEAVKILEDMKVKIEIPKAAVTQWERNAALDMAIESLSCSESPNSSDLISRQAAIDGVKTLHDVAWKNWHEPTLSANVVLDMIGELPSAQPERPTGEWLRMSDLSEKDDNRYKCSRCGNVIHHKSRMDLYTFNSWCGRCGSDNSRHTT